MSSAMIVTIPNVELTLDQLLAAVRQLEPEARLQLARALLETELDGRMALLISRLARRPSVDDISDADIVAEVVSVRSQGNP